MNELYQKIIKKTGIIMEFGVRWGQNIALFNTLKGIYEPYNYNRKIVGFDTFEGFQGISENDGKDPVIKNGSYSVPENYETFLSEIINIHKFNNPISHLSKCELIKGDASVKIKEYIEKHPETIISFVYFDFDIYKPTRDCLRTILPHLGKGCIIAFDELNFEKFPGETIALKEILNINDLSIKKTMFAPLVSYIEFNT